MCAKCSSLLQLRENFSARGSWGPKQYGGLQGDDRHLQVSYSEHSEKLKEVSKARCVSINEQATSFMKTCFFLCHRHSGHTWKIRTLHSGMQHAKFPKNPPGPLFSLRPANGAAFHECVRMLVKTVNSDVSNCVMTQSYLIRVCVTSFSVTLSPVDETSHY